MSNVKNDHDGVIINPMFMSKDHEGLPTVPHSPVLDNETTKDSTTKEFNDASKGKQIILYLPLIIAIGMVAIVLQIPSVLYLTDPPSIPITLLDNVDLESCSVSQCFYS